MEYFILKPDGEQTGTFTLDQIREMLKSRFIGPDTRYWHEGISDWQPIERIDDSVDFPEPSPDEPRATPPPHKWSGSLARAIPSPHQQKRPSGPLPAVMAMPIPPVVPEAPRRLADVPSPWLSPAAEAADDSPPRPAVTPVRPRRFRRRRLFPRVSAPKLYAVGTMLLALSIVVAVVSSRHPAKSPLSRVTLTGRNVFVLLEQNSINSFEDDMRSSRPIVTLKRLIGQSSDGPFIQSATAGLQAEMARHASEVMQNYLRRGRAKFIDSGTYGTIAYFDDQGFLADPRADDPWVAIRYGNRIVYAYIGSEFILPTQ